MNYFFSVISVSSVANMNNFGLAWRKGAKKNRGYRR
jgi:hypothetical protein